VTTFNRNFDLDTLDIELIESALHDTVRELSAERLEGDEGVQTKERLGRAKDLLGRLHNQKVFYRPSTKPYVGG